MILSSAILRDLANRTNDYVDTMTVPVRQSQFDNRKIPFNSQAILELRTFTVECMCPIYGIIRPTVNMRPCVHHFGLHMIQDGEATATNRTAASVWSVNNNNDNNGGLLLSLTLFIARRVRRWYFYIITTIIITVIDTHGRKTRKKKIKHPNERRNERELYIKASNSDTPKLKCVFGSAETTAGKQA